MNSKKIALVGFLVLLALAFHSSPAAAQGYKVEKSNAPAPPEFSAAVRATLSGDSLRVVGPQGPLCEIWLRKAVPAKASATQELSISYGQLAEGTLVAVVRFPAEVKDYRQQRIKRGVYTLRYALIPVDGNHLGVAPNRDFLLLSPASADTDPATISREALLNLSRKATGSSHPSPWSLPAAEGQPSALPVLTHLGDGDLWTLEFPVQLQPGNAAPTVVVMSLVVVGHAPEA